MSRDGFGSPVPRQPAHLHTQAESGGKGYFSRVIRKKSTVLYDGKMVLEVPVLYTVLPVQYNK